MAIALGVTLAGCGGLGSDSGAYCEQDRDCSFVCGHHQRCLDEGRVLSLQIQWTVAGLEANLSSCASIDGLDITISDLQGPGLRYFGVTCSLGQIFYPKLPQSVHQIVLRSYDASGSTLSQDSVDFDGRQDNLMLSLDL